MILNRAKGRSEGLPLTLAYSLSKRVSFIKITRIRGGGGEISRKSLPIISLGG